MFKLENILNAKGIRVEIPETSKIVNNSFVKKLRNSLNMTQKSFAIALGVCDKTIEKWEKPDSTINESAKKLLYLLDKHNYLIDDLYRRIDEKVEINDKEYIYSFYKFSDEKKDLRNSLFITYLGKNKDKLYNEKITNNEVNTMYAKQTNGNNNYKINSGELA